MRLGTLALLAALALPITLPYAPVHAQEGEAAEAPEGGMTAEQFLASLDYKRGEIVLGDGLATLQVPESFAYLGPDDALRLLVDAWGNPPMDAPLGVLIPSDVSPLSDEGWAVIVTFEEDGYIEDDDAGDIDYDDLLSDMKEGIEEENEARAEAGYGTLALIGWAATPHYDAATNKLYWAKELEFNQDPDHTLNYNIRVLGRRGTLVLNAVSSMTMLPQVETGMQQVMGFVDFNAGHRYADFVPGTDTIAAYGIGALVAGKVAAKAGFFKVILGALIAGKKFVIIGVIAIGAFLKRLFTGEMKG